MKKTYINPVINVVAIHTTGMLAQSGGGVTTSSTVGKDYTSGDVSYGRGGMFDEDEE